MSVWIFGFRPLGRPKRPVVPNRVDQASRPTAELSGVRQLRHFAPPTLPCNPKPNGLGMNRAAVLDRESCRTDTSRQNRPDLVDT